MSRPVPSLLVALLIGCASQDMTGLGDSATADSDHERGVDADGDGYSLAEGDCDDGDGERSPGAAEVCDGIDNDCDGSVDEDGYLELYVDHDSDGFGEASEYPLASCEPIEGFVANGEDCDDTNAAVAPGALETCDGVDQDCDGEIDEEAVDAHEYHADADGDGFGGDSTYASCAASGLDDASDCDDADASVHPGAGELCGDGTDNDCDGYTDEMVAGWTHASIQAAIDAACADGDTVWVTAGTWVENLSITRSISLVSLEGYGTTIVDGSGCIYGSDECAVVRVDAPDVTVRGFTLTAGRSSGNGGGIEVVASTDRCTVSITENEIYGNRAVRGGGISVEGPVSGYIGQNTVRNNIAAQGAGIYANPVGSTEDVLLVDDNTIEDNHGEGTSEGGGALDNSLDGVVEWSANIIVANSATFGGGLCAWHDLRTSGNSITSNTAETAGGGVFCASAGEWYSTADSFGSNTPDDSFCYP